MNQDLSKLIELSQMIEELGQLAQTVYNESEDFPAVNRNIKRILASVEMLRINMGAVPYDD
jgi:hypothetical protein